MNQQIINKEEKNRIYFKSKPKLNVQYPHLQDNQFQKKIALKQQFQMKYNGEIKQIRDKKTTMCASETFSLEPHQEFVKAFISSNTFYNGLLLYHGMGSGKTCSAICISEEYRKQNKYNKSKKRILVIASPNIQDNFKLQLFDPDKLEKKNGIWQLDGCVGEAILQELNYQNIQMLQEDALKSKIRTFIRRNYEFMGYEKFGNSIQKVVEKYESMDSGKEKQIKREMRELFSERMIIVDEAHNMRTIGVNDTNKIAAKGFLTLLKYVKHMKLLLLSGTPMYNSPREIIFLLNLLNMNDGQSKLKTKDVFQKDDTIKEGGEKKLLMKANGYVSYVRGENPYRFPFKVFPNDYHSKHSIKQMSAYPSKQFNFKPIGNNTIKHLDLFVTSLSEYQQNCYNDVISKIESDYEPEVWKLMYKNNNDEDIKQYEDIESFSYSKIQKPIYALTFSVQKGDNIYVGKQALKEVVQYIPSTKMYSYVQEERVFHSEHIGKYSAKIKSVLDCIENSNGIILIYSQYLDAGLVPMALALEEMGLNRLGESGNLLQQDSSSKTFKGKYAMITGDKQFSVSNSKELQIINHKSNVNGEKCKVVLISQAGSEGIDFKHLRQVHILDPWFNLNRIDQIIGRAIRNCSHHGLPLKQRNCQIFLHASKSNDDRECADMMVYRLAEAKAQKIGKVQKLLKSVSVDCILNASQQNFANLNQTLTIQLSNQKKIKDFDISDKPNSSICDYGTCAFRCIHSIENNDIINQTAYKPEHDVRVHLISKIKKLFQKKHVFKKSQLVELLKGPNITINHIHHALTYLIENENEVVLDKFFRKGRVINIKDLYIFQPIETNTVMTLEELSKPFLSKMKSIDQEYIQMEPSNSNENVEPVNGNSDIIEALKEQFEREYQDYEPSIKLFLNQIQDRKDTIVSLFDLSFLNSVIWMKIMDTLDVKKELQLLDIIYGYDGEDPFKVKIKKYFESSILEHNGIVVYYLVDLVQKHKESEELSPNKIPYYVKLYIYDESKKQWEKISRIQIEEIGYHVLVDFLIKKNNNLSKYVGYFDYRHPQKEYVFKIMDMRKKRTAPGAILVQKNPKDVKTDLNELLGIMPEIFDIKDKRTYTRVPLCMLMEFILQCLHLRRDKTTSVLSKLEHSALAVKKLI